jgi:hypothetical protein
MGVNTMWPCLHNCLFLQSVSCARVSALMRVWSRQIDICHDMRVLGTLCMHAGMRRRMSKVPCDLVPCLFLMCWWGSAHVYIDTPPCLLRCQTMAGACGVLASARNLAGHVRRPIICDHAAALSSIRSFGAALSSHHLDGINIMSIAAHSSHDRLEWVSAAVLKHQVGCFMQHPDAWHDEVLLPAGVTCIIRCWRLLQCVQCIAVQSRTQLAELCGCLLPRNLPSGTTGLARSSCTKHTWWIQPVGLCCACVMINELWLWLGGARQCDGRDLIKACQKHAAQFRCLPAYAVVER